MAIIITNMDMPETCGECILHRIGAGHCELGIMIDSLYSRSRECPLKSEDDVAPVIHAKWIRHHAKFGEGGDHRECSKCNVWFIWDMPRNSYCPNCGAKMIEPQQ